MCAGGGSDFFYLVLQLKMSAKSLRTPLHQCASTCRTDMNRDIISQMCRGTVYPVCVIRTDIFAIHGNIRHGRYFPNNLIPTGLKKKANLVNSFKTSTHGYKVSSFNHILSSWKKRPIVSLYSGQICSFNHVYTFIIHIYVVKQCYIITILSPSIFGFRFADYQYKNNSQHGKLYQFLILVHPVICLQH